MTINHKFSVSTCVIRLLDSSLPFAVFFTIVAIIIFSAYAMFRAWSKTHVVYKVFKVVPKTLYTSCTVPIVFCVFWVVALLTHTFPDSILRRPVFSLRESVLSVGIFGSFSHIAAAGLCMSSPHLAQRNPIYNFFTKTLAFEHSTPIKLFHFFDNSKSTVGVALLNRYFCTHLFIPNKNAEKVFNPEFKIAGSLTAIHFSA